MAEPVTGRTITVAVDRDRACWRPRTAVVFAGAAGGGTSGPAADRSCGYINFFTTARAAQVWARRHPEVSGTVMRRDGALRCGIAEFGALLQPRPPSAKVGPAAGPQ
jgi:Alkylmercury lyase